MVVEFQKSAEGPVFGPETCNRCGLCARVCHAHCLRVGRDGVVIDERLCTTCGQCVAVCPTGAATWNGVPSRLLDGERLPGYASLVELFRARRSVRHFRKRPVDRTTLEQVAATARLAPTNSFELETVIVGTPEGVAALESIALRFVARVYRWAYGPRPVFALLKRLNRGMNETDRVKMQRVLRERNMFYGAPAMILVTGDPRTYYASESAQYALYNMTLAAQTLGLGTCISGAGRRILARSREVRGRLDLGRGRAILGVLLVGYPAVRFTRAVEGRDAMVRWIDPRA